MIGKPCLRRAALLCLALAFAVSTPAFAQTRYICQSGPTRYYIRRAVPSSFELPFRLRITFDRSWRMPQEVPQEAPREVPQEDGSKEEQAPPQQAPAFSTPEEAQMLALINAERSKASLPPLVQDESLTKLARQKSEDMIRNGYFSHQSPTYGSPFDMMRRAGISYLIAGENIAGASSVAAAHSALMNSEGHRRNILNPSFTHIGIGAVKGGPYGMMFCQMFIGR